MRCKNKESATNQQVWLKVDFWTNNLAFNPLRTGPLLSFRRLLDIVTEP